MPKPEPEPEVTQLHSEVGAKFKIDDDEGLEDDDDDAGVEEDDAAAAADGSKRRTSSRSSTSSSGQVSRIWFFCPTLTRTSFYFKFSRNGPVNLWAESAEQAESIPVG